MADETRSTPERRDPAIRTMRSDISEFLKTSQPSLVSLLTRQAEMDQNLREAPKSRRGFKIAATMGSLILLLGGIAAYYYAVIVPPAAPPPPPLTAGTAPVISYEAVTEVIIGQTRREITEVLRSAGETPGTTGAFRRLTIGLRSVNGAAALLSLHEFFELAGTNPPADLTANHVSPPQFFIHRQTAGQHLGIIAFPRNPARALAALHRAEASLQRELEPMFLGSPLPFSLAPFEDRTWRNLGYRYLALDGGGRGIGYLHFAAKRLIVIATSEETIRQTIDRLFQTP